MSSRGNNSNYLRCGQYFSKQNKMQTLQKQESKICAPKKKETEITIFRKGYCETKIQTSLL